MEKSLKEIKQDIQQERINFEELKQELQTEIKTMSDTEFFQFLKENPKFRELIQRRRGEKVIDWKKYLP